MSSLRERFEQTGVANYGCHTELNLIQTVIITGLKASIGLMLIL